MEGCSEELCDLFRGIANCKIGDGSTVLFWSDLWNDNVMQIKFPRLYSFAKNKNISVSQFLLNNSLQSQFHLPLSEQAYHEYQGLQEYILKILGVTCEGAGTIRHLDSTTYPTKIYSLLLPFSGFGIQSAATNSECSPGFCSWIG